MRKAALALLLVVPWWPGGCASSPWHAYHEALARRLPEGVGLHDEVENVHVGPYFGREINHRVDLGEKLALLGAYPDSDGKLYDGAGKRIEVVTSLDDVAPADEREQARRAELRQVATVIEVRRAPAAAPQWTAPAQAVSRPADAPAPPSPPAPTTWTAAQ